MPETKPKKTYATIIDGCIIQLTKRPKGYGTQLYRIKIKSPEFEWQNRFIGKQLECYKSVDGKTFKTAKPVIDNAHYGLISSNNVVDTVSLWKNYVVWFESGKRNEKRFKTRIECINLIKKLLNKKHFVSFCTNIKYN